MVGRKAYMLNAGDIFVLDEIKDGQVSFRANELRLTVSERVVELMAPATAQPTATSEIPTERPAPIAPRVRRPSPTDSHTPNSEARSPRRPYSIRGASRSSNSRA